MRKNLTAVEVACMLAMLFSFVGLAYLSCRLKSAEAGWARAAREVYASENRNAMCASLVDQCCK